MYDVKGLPSIVTSTRGATAWGTTWMRGACVATEATTAAVTNSEATILLIDALVWSLMHSCGFRLPPSAFARSAPAGPAVALAEAVRRKDASVARVRTTARSD